MGLGLDERGLTPLRPRMLDGFHGEIEGPVGDLLYAEGVQKGVREGPIGGLEHSGGRHAAKGGPGLGVGLAH